MTRGTLIYGNPHYKIIHVSHKSPKYEGKEFWARHFDWLHFKDWQLTSLESLKSRRSMKILCRVRDFLGICPKVRTPQPYQSFLTSLGKAKNGWPVWYRIRDSLLQPCWTMFKADDPLGPHIFFSEGFHQPDDIEPFAIGCVYRTCPLCASCLAGPHCAQHGASSFLYMG